MSVGMKFCSRVVLLVGAALMTQVALAHPGHEASTHSLIAGFAHPFTGLDHLLAMVAVGIWAAQLGRQALWALPLVFPLVMALGGAMGVYGMGLPGVEIGIAVSSLVLGLMVVAKVRLQAGLAAVIVGGLALFHGYAHGVEMPANASAVSYGIGFVLGTFVLHLAGMMLGSLHRFGTGASALRGIGAGIAGAGTWFLVQALA